MKFKKEFENFEKLRECSCIALTGNGSSEVGLVEVVTQKLDGTLNLLCFPHYPSKLGVTEEMQKKFEPRTTLAILKVLANYVEASIHGPFLVILDLENFKTNIVKDVKNQIERDIKSFSLKEEIKRINSSDDKALLINCQNEKIFTIVMCAMGDKTCPKTEIHIAKVIEYKYGVWIDPCQDKEEFRERVKQTTGTKNYGKVVTNLEIEDLVKFFPQLMISLKAIEDIIEP